MRIVPPLTAVAVAASLYLAVFERDRLTSLIATDPAPETAAEPAPAESVEGAISVVAMRSVAQEVQNAVLARGRSEAARQVEVRSETSGLVVSNPLRRGAFVTEGQVLCRLAPGTRAAQAAEAQARLSEARARLTEAQNSFDTANRLNEGGFGSETQRISAQAGLESARAGLQSAEAGVAAIQAEIDRLTIAAPFAGILETDTAEMGSLLQPGGACATVIQLDPVKIVGFVPEADVDKISVGAMAGARFISGREVAGRVTFLSRSADAATRTFRVELTVPNTGLEIRDGQTAEMLIASSGVKAHLVPASCLTLDNGGTLGVRLATEDGTAVFAPVSVLRDTTEGTLVTGLPDDATIITVGQEFVTDGTRIKVTLQEAQP